MTNAVLLDFLASLAILTLLAESYGTLRRRLFGLAVAPIVLGLLFGIVSVIEMARPIEPFEGVLIDLRNIPIALAGAFLGWRGLLPCMAIAIFARLELGGVGAFAGVAGIVMAGLAGMIWARQVANQNGRTFTMLLCLAIAMSSHLLAAVIMPRELALWFFTNAAGPLLAVNLIVVPFIGAIMVRENRRITREQRMVRVLQDGAAPHPLRGPAFADAVKSAFAAHPFGTFGGLLIIGPRSNFLSSLWRLIAQNADERAALQPLVLEGLVEHSELVGRSIDGRLFIPLTDAEIARGASIVHDLRAHWRAHQMETNKNIWRPLHVDAQVLPVPDPSQFLRIINQVARSHLEAWPMPRHLGGTEHLPDAKSPRRQAPLFDPTEHNALFAKADFLMENGKR